MSKISETCSDLSGLKLGLCEEFVKQCETPTKTPDAETLFVLSTEDGNKFPFSNKPSCLTYAKHLAKQNKIPARSENATAPGDTSDESAKYYACRSQGLKYKDAALAILDKVRRADECPGGVDADEVQNIVNKYGLNPPGNGSLEQGDSLCDYKSNMKEMLGKVINNQNAIEAMQENEQGPITGCKLSEGYKTTTRGGEKVHITETKLDCSIAETLFSGVAVQERTTPKRPNCPYGTVSDGARCRAIPHKKRR